VTARHDKATEKRTEGAAADQAIFVLKRLSEIVRGRKTDGFNLFTISGDELDELDERLRVLADAVERKDAEINRLRSEMNQ
jgi:hypothetical protein